MMENGGIFSQTLIPIGNSPTSALWFATPGCLPQRKSRRRSESDKISPQDVQYFLKRLWTCVCVIKTLNCLRVFVHSHGKVVLHLSSCMQLPSIVFRSWKPSKMPQSCYYCQSIQLHKDHQCLCWFYYTSFFLRRLYVLHVKIWLLWYFAEGLTWKCLPNGITHRRTSAVSSVEQRAEKKVADQTTWGTQSRGGGTKSKVTSPFQIVIHQNSWLKGFSIDIHRFKSSSKAVDVWKYPANQLRLLVLSHHFQEICYISKGD